MTSPAKTSTDAATLAIYGGAAAVPGGRPAWPLPDEAVRMALQEAWSNGDWGRYHGRYCQQLTVRLGELHELEHVQLCCSGTYAVEAALRGLGVGTGDEVILAAYDFPGNFRAVEVVGARPVLVDINPDTWSVDPEQLAKAQSPSTRTLIVSHLHGGLVPMQPVMNWATAANVRVIEDACQAPGARCDGQLIGTLGDVCVLSFGGSKLLTAGRGGALLTRHADVFQRAKIVGHRGNEAFPLSEIQAAVLIPQLEKLAERNELRRINAERLLHATADLPFLQPLKNSSPAAEPSYYKLAWLYLPSELNRCTREAFLAAIDAEGVALDAGFRGFAGRSERRCRKPVPLAHSTAAAENTVILHHPVLTGDPAVIEQTATALNKMKYLAAE